MNNLDAFRPIPFYFLTTRNPADYTMKAVDDAMDAVKQAGFGGIVFFNKPPHGFDAESYLSDFYYEVLERFVLSCRERGLALWINDGFNYPPGDAAGRIEAVNPNLHQLRIRPNAEGRLEVITVPWGFPAFEDEESSRLFREIVYNGHKAHLGQYFGNGISGFFSDADNRRVNAALARLLGPERYYPWSRTFAEKFRSRFGYAIEEKLKELFAASDASVCRDYWQLAGELYQQWFANNAKWCEENNLGYTFHTSDTGPLEWKNCHRSSLFTEGNPIDLLMHSQMPGTDHEILVLDSGTHYDARLFSPKVSRGAAPEKLWHPRFNDTKYDARAKYAGSVAALKGARRSMCEMFAATNWGASYQDLRRISTWQIMQGINFIVPHAVHHRFGDWSKFFAPPEFIHGTNWHGIRAFNDSLARACQAEADGVLKAEVALVDPTPEAWGDASTELFFRMFDRLNRYPGGYVICPRELAGKYPCVIDTSKISSVDDVVLPKVDIAFSGGEVLFMRRELANGTEYLLVANVWHDEALNGILDFHGRRMPLALEPGEIAIIGGPYESFRVPHNPMKELKVWRDELPVSWKSWNLVPFNRQLKVQATSPMKLKLHLPANTLATLDGILMNNGAVPAPATLLTGTVTPGNNPLWDDTYLSYDLELADSNEHILKLHDMKPGAGGLFETPALLEGEFNVKSIREGDYAKKVKNSYMLEMYEPEEELTILSPRGNRLSPSKGWEEQGGLFYSGMVDYDLGTVFTTPGDILAFDLSGTAELLVDGVSASMVVARPYEFLLKAETGEHHLVLRCSNTMGNRMERYAEPSGLVGAPRLLRAYSTCGKLANSEKEACFQPFVFKASDGSTLNYRLMSPLNVEQGREYPIILFLHGAGERGSDNFSQLAHTAYGFLSREFREAYPCFILFPQCPCEEQWVNVPWADPEGEPMPEPSRSMKALLELLEHLYATQPIDSRRRYLMGFSMGGYGSWDILQRQPAAWAAAAICCGGGDKRLAHTLKDIPIRCYHGDCDTSVPMARTVQMAEAIKAAGGNKIQMTIYPGIAHDSWDAAFFNPELYEWMFRQSLG